MSSGMLIIGRRGADDTRGLSESNVYILLDGGAGIIARMNEIITVSGLFSSYNNNNNNI